jgi:hypothetical protein
MPVIVVTRLRLKDPEFFDEFFAAAVAVVEQAKSTDGNLAADVLADENGVYWTRTGWIDRVPMQDFVGREPHLSTMAHIDDWCDEGTFVDWEQDGRGLPDWQTSFDRLVADGQIASLTHGTEAHRTRSFPAPVEAP